MAIVAGDQVAITRATGETLSCDGNVLFGTCIAVSGTATVLWDNGVESSSDIPLAYLDKIVGNGNAPAGVAQFNDAGSASEAPSPEYRCLVVRSYSRQNNASGPVVDYYLLRALSNGQLYEAPASAVSFVSGV